MIVKCVMLLMVLVAKDLALKARNHVLKAKDLQVVKNHALLHVLKNKFLMDKEIPDILIESIGDFCIIYLFSFSFIR